MISMVGFGIWGIQGSIGGGRKCRFDFEIEFGDLSDYQEFSDKPWPKSNRCSEAAWSSASQHDGIRF
jgi:hypothetical protein